MVRRIVVISVGTLIGLTLFLWLAVVRPFLAGGRQVHNYAHLQYYAGALSEYRDANGRFPERLREAVALRVDRYPGSRDELWLACLDIWGNPLAYETNGEQYVLASYGQDGVRDAPHLPQFKDATLSDKAPCRSLSVDTIVSERGIHQACYK